MRAALRPPKTLGELFSDATALMRTHLAPVFFLALPFITLELFARESASSFFFAVRRALGPEPTTVEELAPLFGRDAALAVGLFFVSRLVIQGGLAALTIMADHVDETGRAMEPREAFAAAVRFFPRLLVAELVFDVVVPLCALLPATAIVVAGMASGSPALTLLALPLAMFVALAVGISLYLRFVLYPQVLILENCGPIAALLRSARWMSPRGVRFVEGPKLRVSILFLVYWALASSIQSVFLIPVAVLGFAQGIPLSELPPPLTQIPLWASIPLAILQVVGNSVVVPIAAILPTLFYRDLKVRAALDGAPPSTTTAAAP